MTGDELDGKIADDIIKHAMTRVHDMTKQSLEIIPEGHELQLLTMLSAQTLVTLAQALGQAAPLFGKLDLQKRLMVLALAYGRSLGYAPPAPSPQTASDIVAATLELKPLFSTLRIDIE